MMMMKEEEDINAPSWKQINITKPPEFTASYLANKFTRFIVWWHYICNYTHYTSAPKDHIPPKKIHPDGTVIS
jgi:hypothetical protein